MRWLAVAGLALLAGCSSIGPGTVARDRFDYVDSISASLKRQTLLNLLKVRYSDAPVFLDVASVINSYELQAELSALAQAADPGRGDNFVNLGGSGRYSDRPTITYSPLSGDKFARSLMTPVPIPAILLMLQSGYPADLILRVTLNTVNGLENAYGGPGNPRPGSAQFHELLALMRESQSEGGMGMEVETTGQRQSVVLFLRRTADQRTLARNGRIAELLGVDAKANRFTVTYGTFPSGATDVAMQSRSLLQIMTDFASYLEVPGDDVAQGRVYAVPRDAEALRMFPPMVQVSHGDAAPADAHVAVRYRGRWFWIDDRDFRSKTMLNVVILMFSLTETGGAQAAPVVTVPAR